MTTGRRTAQDFADELAGLRRRARRARRGGVIGGAVGLVLGLGGLLLAGSPDTTLAAVRIAAPLLEVVAAACIGFALGHAVGALQLLLPLAAEPGYGPDAQRIRRAALGRPADLAPAEEERAARYAAASIVIRPVQVTRIAIVWFGILCLQLARFSEDLPRPDGFTLVIGSVTAGLLVALVVAVALNRRVIRRMRRWSAAHPPPGLIDRGRTSPPRSGSTFLPADAPLDTGSPGGTGGDGSEGR